MRFRTAILVALSVLSDAYLFSQSFTGSILGIVTDSSGAAIQRVMLSAVNQETGERRGVESTEVGQFTLSALPPGNYTLEAEFTGFRKYRRENLRVDVLQNVRVDVALEPGEVTQVLNVSAESPLLETTNASIGQVVENRKIIDLPLIGRNTITLVALTTGVQPASVNAFGNQPVLSNPYDHGAFSLNSGLQMGSEFLLDGVPNNAFLWDAPAFVPSIDAVQEFKVQGSGISAEFGHSGGGIINLTTKSGTNHFHGTLFEFLRNDKLDANNFFNNRNGQPKPPLKTNEFGGSIGGPVRFPGYNGKNKTFFFFSYDGFRDRRPGTTLTTVPNLALRQGDFSLLKNAAGPAIGIYDPLTVRANAGVGSGYIRDAFPGNRIPANRIDPVAGKVANFWAAPNLPGNGPAEVTNFFGSVTRADLQDQINTKVDHMFNANHRMFGRFSFHRQLPGQSDLFKTVRGASGGGVIDIWTRSLALDHTWTLSPTVLASFRYGFSRQHWINDPLSLGIDLKGLGFPASFSDAVQERIMPSFAVTGLATIGEAGSNSFIHRGDNMHSAQVSVTKALTRQTLKTGFEFRTFLFNDIRAPDSSGTFSFTTASTQSDPLRAAATAGSGFASFLLGYPVTGSMQFFPAVWLNQSYYALYLQDDIRLNSNLTINLGLRWDMETPKTERYNRLVYFDPNVRSPLSDKTGLNLLGGLQFTGVNGNDRGQWVTDWNNFAPRAGFAYRLTPKFVMRGGYGILYHQTVGQGGAIGHGNDGYGATNAMITTLDGGITVANRVSNPYPQGLSLPIGSQPGLLARVGNALRPWSGTFANPYSQRYNFGFERELPGALLIDIALVGSRSIGLPIIIPENQLQPQYQSLGSQLLNQVNNPFAGLIPDGPLSLPRVAQNLLFRPFLQFGDISLYTPIAQASYNSMQLKLERRFRNDFGFLLSYTFSKSLTDAGNTGIFGFQVPGIQNVYDLRGEKSVSPIDVTHRVVVSYQWELPFGKGKRLLGSLPKGVNQIVSGWQFNGISTFQSGLPLELTNSVNQTNVFGLSSRPNIAPGASATLSGSDRSLARWFDTSVFSQPAAFTFGNVSRTLSRTRVPGLENLDLSLFKNSRLWEKATLQFRIEAFNAFNHTNFGAPGQVLGTPQFGIISGANSARAMQVGAKIVF